MATRFLIQLNKKITNTNHYTYDHVNHKESCQSSKFSTVTKKQRDDRNTYLGLAFYKSYAEFEKNWLRTCDPEPPTDGDTVALARRLIEKYADKIKN